MRTPPFARTRLAAALVGGLVCGTGAAPALAQGTAATEAGEPVEVTVTTNRREQISQKVSGVVQSLSAEQLRKDGITELRQVQVAVPGLSIANQEGNVEIFIRGVGSANNTELGDPGAAPHLNGIYIPRPRGLGLMFYDLERVEVNKGPQGTLYGRNALAGTLNIITAKPRLGQTGGYAQFEVSNRDGMGLEGAFSLPVGPKSALRMAFMTQDKDYGYRNHTATVAAQTANPSSALQTMAKLTPAGQEQNHALRLSWLWEPGEKLRVSLVADSGREQGTGYPGANIYEAVRNSGKRPEALDLRKVVYRGTQGEMRNELWGLQTRVDYLISDSLTAELSLSVRDVDFYQRNATSTSIDYPGRNYSGVQWDDYSSQYWVTKSRSTIGELRLVSEHPKNRFNWSAGLFSFNEDQQVGYLSLQDRGYCCYSGTEFTMPKVDGKSTAVFVDGTFKASDSLRVLGGLRHTREEKYRFGIGGNLALTLGGENWDCCIATRFGTEGFVPALLNRSNFNVTGLNKQQQAQWLVNSTLVPGSRDTMIQQIGAIANGSNPNGTCFTRPDIDNGFVRCPSTNPSNTNGGFSYANLTIPQQQEGRSKASYGDARIGFELDLGKDRMLYGKLSTGHKAGGFNDSFASQPIPEAFLPEKVTVAEIGLRNAFSFGGRRALFNVTGFAYDYQDQVFQDLTCINFDATRTPPCNSYSLVNRNVGKSAIKGLEMDARLPLTASVRLDLNAVYLDTRIKSGTVADVRGQDWGQGGLTPLISLAGNRLPLASKFNIAARLQQSFPLASGRFDWQLLLSYRSDYHLTQFNERDVVFLNGTRETALKAGFADRQPGFTMVNLGFGYQLGKLRTEFFANNVTNEQVSNKAIVGSGLDIRFLADARSYGMRVRYDF